MHFSESELILLIEEKTGLLFQENESEHNLCFRSQNSELRDDFKEVFTVEDIRFYQLAFAFDSLILPKNSHEFWEKVKLGKNKHFNSSNF